MPCWSSKGKKVQVRFGKTLGGARRGQRRKGGQKHMCLSLGNSKKHRIKHPIKWLKRERGS